ncbi:MFS transporter [Klebsiella variicola]
MSRVSQARSLGKYFLLVDNMLVVLGFFVVFPLISIRFVDQMGWAALMVGIALGLRQLVQQGLGIFGGAIADRFGAKPMIVTGMLMRAGAALFIACAAFNAWYLPAWKLSTVKTPVREGLGRVLRDKRFVTYVLTLTGYYMLAVQVMLMLPIMVNDIAGSPAAVKWMYAIEATISLTLLYPIARWSEKRYRLEHRLMAGLLVMTLAMLPIGMTSSLQQLFTLICLFYIGSIIAEPARETLGASLADARARGSYMGFSRLGLAFGGALGYAGGGWLFDAGKAVGQPELPWLMLGAIGFITFLALWWQFSPKRSASGMLEPRT